MASLFTYARSIERFAAIFFILFRQFLALVPYRLFFAPSAREEQVLGKYLKPEKKKISAPEIAKETLEKLGPTFVKFGQFLSIRPDLVPPEFCEEFKKLQDKVPPVPFSLIKKELEKELRCAYTEVFSEFDQFSVAAASVSQVHRARLRTGEEAAVKVQRPGVREAMVSDILIMLFFANLLERCMPSLRKNQPVLLIHEFSHWTDRELYFRQEGKNALHFAYHFRNYPNVRIPKVFREFTTKKVLVMEYIRGVNVLSAAESESDRKSAAHLIADSMLKQLFVDGFFHGDPHAGNILLLPDKSIAYLDFGIVGYLSKDLRAWTFDILYGMSECDSERVIAAFLELCDVRRDHADLPGYRRRVNEVLSELPIYEMAGIPFSQMIQRFLNTSLEFGIRIPHEFVLVSKAICTLEGTCLCLDPDIKIMDYLRPFAQKYVSTLPGFDELLKQLKAGPFELGRMKRLAAKHGLRALQLLENPTFRIAGEEFQSMKNEIDKASVNIAYGFIIAALIVFAASSANGSEFERWLRAFLHVPVAPLLPLLSLGAAGYLWVRLYIRNRHKKCELD
jgi:ubiquinone biosynthesis protein